MEKRAIITVAGAITLTVLASSSALAVNFRGADDNSPGDVGTFTPKDTTTVAPQVATVYVDVPGTPTSVAPSPSVAVTAAPSPAVTVESRGWCEPARDHDAGQQLRQRRRAQGRERGEPLRGRWRPWRRLKIDWPRWPSGAPDRRPHRPRQPRGPARRAAPVRRGRRASAAPLTRILVTGASVSAVLAGAGFLALADQAVSATSPAASQGPAAAPTVALAGGAARPDQGGRRHAPSASRDVCGRPGSCRARGGAASVPARCGPTKAAVVAAPAAAPPAPVTTTKKS